MEILSLYYGYPMVLDRDYMVKCVRNAQCAGVDGILAHRNREHRTLEGTTKASNLAAAC